MDSTHNNNIYSLSLETYIKLVSVIQIRKIKMQYQFFLELIRIDLNKQGENYSDLWWQFWVKCSAKQYIWHWHKKNSTFQIQIYFILCAALQTKSESESHWYIMILFSQLEDVINNFVSRFLYQSRKK